MFTGERPFDTMAIGMKPEDATRWFGVAPPDLSLIARSRGTGLRLHVPAQSFYARSVAADGREQPRAARHGDAARALGAAGHAGRV